ncbi:MAG: type I-U CRISPR-associated protein Csx17, partial [Myxococcota bacterium]|nr:type I-U CRISPR-associated protein Csx17 [Myxococcota bacterium]
MTLHLHHLTGCAPTPLAHYLKALGVLRLVGEQKDLAARGFWQDEHFCLVTALDRDQLERFFLREYEPTPFVSPWNKGAGFFKKDDPGLAPLERSVAPRFATFRAGIAASRRPLDDLSKVDAEIRALKDRTKSRTRRTAVQKDAAEDLKSDPEFKTTLATAERRYKQIKQDLITPLQREWRGPERAWMDAALVLPEEGKPVYPALLGTGGNDGRLDFTNNAMQRLSDLFDLESVDGSPRPGADELLREAFWSLVCRGLGTGKVGQFFPGTAGGANNTTGPEGESLLNPWDFVLVMEGAVLFAARATRRLDPAAARDASAPFVVRAHGAGHATAGAENADRGEQWMPLWSRPTSLSEVRALIGEARAQVGRRVAR